MNIAKAFYLWRKSRGAYSQRELAIDLLVHRSTAQRWTTGSFELSGTALSRTETAIWAWERAESRRSGERIRMPRD